MNNSSKKNEVVVTTTLDIGNLIREARKSAGVTQARVAGISGCGNRFIVDAENGKSTIQAQKLLDLANMVGLEIVIRKKS